MLARVLPAAAASLAAVVLVAAPAGADAYRDFLTEAQAPTAAARDAQAAAYRAYVDRDFAAIAGLDVTVAASADAVEGLRDEAQDVLDAAESRVAAAQRQVEEARDVVDAYAAQVAVVDQAQRTVDAAQADLDAKVPATAAALATLQGTSQTLPTQEFCTPGAPVPDPITGESVPGPQNCTWTGGGPNPAYATAQTIYTNAQAAESIARTALTNAQTNRDNQQGVLDGMDDGIVRLAGAEESLGYQQSSRDDAADQVDGLDSLLSEFGLIASTLVGIEDAADEVVAFEHRELDRFGRRVGRQGGRQGEADLHRGQRVRVRPRWRGGHRDAGRRHHRIV
ncbi:hypothetical protein [Demequina litorisediminis]|uniref:hypothetical protein n=1 Tax=Demequina litorisediminis TaxID=1849022 RepID=UPI0024E06F46|nr:hypothetical protein [Demequina litorisediminis]